MKIYLAATAPGNEENIKVRYRLLSYFLIQKKQLEAHKVFNKIKKNGNK